MPSRDYGLLATLADVVQWEHRTTAVGVRVTDRHSASFNVFAVALMAIKGGQSPGAADKPKSSPNTSPEKLSTSLPTMQSKVIATLACLALCSVSAASDVPRSCATFGGLTRDELGTSLRQVGDRVRAVNAGQETDPGTAQFLDSLHRLGQNYSDDDVYDEFLRTCGHNDGDREVLQRRRDLSARQDGDALKQLVTSVLGGLGTWY